MEVTRSWRDGLVDDETYLTIMRDVYLMGFTGWPLGRQVRFVAAGLGLSFDIVAYVNAARCQYPEVPPALQASRLTKPALQRLCLDRFPVSRLVTDLDPQLVLFTSVTAFDEPRSRPQVRHPAPSFAASVHRAAHPASATAGQGDAGRHGARRLDARRSGTIDPPGSG